MNKVLGSISVLLGFALFLFGCTGSGDLSAIAKLDPTVQQFLVDHPNAEIKVTLMNSDQMDAIASTIQTQCDVNLAKTDHYYVRVTDPDTSLELYVWINASTQQTVCAYKKGSSGTDSGDDDSTPPTDTNTTSADSDDDNGDDGTDSGDDNGEDNGDDTTPTDNNVVTQPVIERVKVGNVYVSIAEIELDSYGTAVSEIKLRIDNETDVEQSISKKVSVSILNADGETIDISKYQPFFVVSNIKELQFATFSSLFLYENLSSGTYTVKIGIYNEGSTDTSTYLTKDIAIGPDSDKKIIYPRKIESFTATDSIMLGQVKALVEKIELNSYGTSASSIRLRFENDTVAEQAISKYVSITVLNSKNEVVDVSRFQSSLSISAIREVQFSTQNSLALYEELPVGTYTIIAKVYNSGSAKSSTYLTKTINIGPDELRDIEYTKKVKVYTVTAGELTKATLNSYGTAVEGYSYKISGTSVSGKYISAVMLNDKNEIVDVSRFQSIINASNIVNDLFAVSTPAFYEELPNGTYTLLAEIYNSNSSVPGFIMAKKVTISPDAPKDQ
ncbi:MAG: hypothetical protein AABW59_02535 [archaeon]